MKLSKIQISQTEKVVTAFLFLFVCIEIIADFKTFDLNFCLFKPIIVLVILGLYIMVSEVKSTFYITALLFIFVTSILLELNPKHYSLPALAGYISYRFILIIYVIKINKVKDFIPVVIAIIPTLFIFSYLLTIADELSSFSFYGLVTQNSIVSIMTVLVVSKYFINETNYSAWFSIYGLLSVFLYFIIFVEKCFLSTFPPTILSALGMILYVSSNYSFYRFVIDTEKISKLK